MTLKSLFASRFVAEPPHRHGQTDHTAIVYCNLGTPDAPNTRAVRRYLAEFLSDPRVVEIPALLWRVILHGIILRTRPAKSAAKYASVWTSQGSPLKVWTALQAERLQTELQQRGHRLIVVYAMRYAQPSIASQLDALKAQGVQRVLVLPAYPQYAASTSASAFDAVYAWAARIRRLPELRFINHYHDHPGYIAALAHSVQAYWQQHGQADVLLMSFHGLPERSLHLGDPYHCESLKTARLLAQALGLQANQYKVSFQSRLGRAQWLQPYTEPTARSLGAGGVARLDVICPGFVADCLETLEEINMECRQAFLESGGKAFHYIPCLNDAPEFIGALADLSEQHLSGWDTRSLPDAAAAQQSQQLAQERGALM